MMLIPFTVMQQSTICSSTIQVGGGKCARSMLDLLFPIFITKILYGIIFAASPVILEETREKIKAFSQRREIQWVGIIERIEAASASMGIPIVLSGTEPDPMEVLSFAEPALILGLSCPVLILGLGVQLGVSGLAHEYALGNAPSSRGDNMPKGFIREPIVMLAVVVVGCQALWCAFSSFDTHANGMWLVISVASAVFFTIVVMLVVVVWRLNLGFCFRG